MTRTTTESEPLSGYAITGVFVINQELKQVPDDAKLPEADEVDLTFSWDWRFSETRDVFEVMLGVSTTASQKRRYTTSVMVVGVFKQVGEVPSLPIKEFVALQAIAILLPYLRQHLAALTMATVAGAFHLPTINVMRLVKAFNPESTSGARQLARREAAKTATPSIEPEQPSAQSPSASPESEKQL